MKKIINSVLLVCFLVCTCGCSKQESDNSVSEIVKAIFLNQDNLTVITNSQVKLLLTADPINADTKKAVWSSSDSKVATVSSDGIVSSLSKGKATISVQLGTLNQKCEVEVVESPVANLALPDAKYSIEKGSPVFLTGKGFPQGCKIWISPIKTSSSAVKLIRKSSTEETNVLATIIAQTENYLAFYWDLRVVDPVDLNNWFSVTMQVEDKKYNLGSIHITESKKIPYNFDMNKRMWDDNHWRYYKLKGDVKEVVVSQKSIDYQNTWFYDSTTYKFNRNGYLESIIAKSDILGSVKTDPPTVINFKYDNQNRLISKSYNTSSSGLVTTEYQYGTSNFYVPYNVMWYSGQIGYDGQAYFMKNLSRIIIKDKDRISEVVHFRFNLQQNSLTLIDTIFFNSINEYTAHETIYSYTGNYPSSSVESSYFYPQGWRYKYNTTYTYASNGNLVQQTKKGVMGEYNTYTQKYASESPFCPVAYYSKENIYNQNEYDTDWNIITQKSNVGVIERKDYIYSYDDHGNWLQGVSIVKKQGEYFTTTRSITYW